MVATYFGIKILSDADEMVDVFIGCIIASVGIVWLVNDIAFWLS
jgi:hypothetical protein